MRTIEEFLFELSKFDIRIWVETGRLRVNAPQGALTPALQAELARRKADILTLLQWRNSTPESAPSLIQPVARDRFLPLSFAQQRLWFLDQLEPGQSVYHVPVAYRFSGSLDVPALEQSLYKTVQRHEILRTRFPIENEQPFQEITSDMERVLAVKNLQHILESERTTVAQHQVNEEVQRPFDLARGPLFRAMLWQLDKEDYILLLVMHHIVTDGWSMDILFRELSILYEAFSTRKGFPLPHLPIQYADFAIWQREWLHGGRLDTQLAYWTRQLADAPVLDLPTDRPRPLRPTSSGAYQTLQLAPHVGELFQTFSQREGTTMFMTLLAAFSVVLSRYTGHTDLCIGTPIANRNHPDIEGLIGFFVNTLVLRIDLSGNPTFRDGLQRVRQVCLEAYTHQDLPFEQLVEALRPGRDVARQPVFQVMFDYSPRSDTAFALPGLVATALELPSDTAKFDLSLSVTDTSEGLRLDVEYNTELFEAATITRLLAHFQTLLAGIAAAPDARLDVLPILSPREYHTIVTAWNRTQTDYPRKSCLHELFEAQVERSPDAIAVVFEDQQLTYRELNAKANQVAWYLKKHGVGPEVLVGICLERSLEMIIGLLGILKAGGAYVPLAPDSPEERLAVMLQQLPLAMVITREPWARQFSESQSVILCCKREQEQIRCRSTENPRAVTTPNNLAYVMYTSGSTGRPKGVSIPHRGVVRLVQETNYASLTADEVFLQFAPLTFDASTFEIWGSLLNGGKLIIMPSGMLSLEELGNAIRNYQVTSLWLTAGLFHLMVDEQLEAFASLRQLLAGGDVLSIPHVRKVIKNLQTCRLSNGYGPTENTTFTCCAPLASEEQLTRSVPLGRPIANTQVYILDPHLQPVPVGISGELYIGGDGLARGYFNHPAATADVFIPHPFGKEPGKRLYKTGDLARYLPNGTIEFLGRRDHQVKIRGFRVELGEIETALRQHPAVRETVVLAQDVSLGHKQLVAYVEPGSQPVPTIDVFREFLKQTVPDYMLPSTFIVLDALPVTPNGKVDRRALPASDGSCSNLGARFVEPRTPVQITITGIWQEFLDVDQIGVYDNFFDLGGHSLLVMQVIARLEQHIGVRLTPGEFMLQTLGQLAVVCDEKIAISRKPKPEREFRTWRQHLRHAISQRLTNWKRKDVRS